MKMFKLILVLSLVGCSGGEFKTADQRFIDNTIEAGAAGQGDAGEINSAGVSAGGSSSFAGSSSGKGGTINNAGSAGQDMGGSTTGGTDQAGSNTGGNNSTAGVGGTGGTTGNAGMGGTNSSPSCSVSQNGAPCIGTHYDWEDQQIPTPYAWECTTSTNSAPFYLEQNNTGGTVRQCVESSFGTPSNLWCCTAQ